MFQARWFQDVFADAAPSASPAASPPVPTAAFTSQRVLVAFATQTGAAEGIAEATLEQLEMAGVDASLVDFYDLEAGSLQQASQVLFLVSTTCDGDPPDMAEVFHDEAMQEPASLAHLHYGLLALGDRDYDTFCGFGHDLDDWLQASGASPWFARIEVDDEDERAISRWHEYLTMLAASPEPRSQP